MKTEICCAAQAHCVVHHSTPPYSAKDADGKDIRENGATSQVNQVSTQPAIGPSIGKGKHHFQGRMESFGAKGEQIIWMQMRSRNQRRSTPRDYPHKENRRTPIVLQNGRWWRMAGWFLRSGIAAPATIS